MSLSLKYHARFFCHGKTNKIFIEFLLNKVKKVSNEV